MVLGGGRLEVALHHAGSRQLVVALPGLSNSATHNSSKLAHLKFLLHLHPLHLVEEADGGGGDGGHRHRVV